MNTSEMECGWEENEAMARVKSFGERRVIYIHITTRAGAGGHAHEGEGEFSSANNFGSAPAPLAFTSLGT